MHILSLVTDNNPSWMIQRKGGSNSRPLDLHSDSHLLPDTLPTAQMVILNLTKFVWWLTYTCGWAGALPFFVFLGSPLHGPQWVCIFWLCCLFLNCWVELNQICEQLKQIMYTRAYKGAQWLSGKVLDSWPKGRGFEPHRRHFVVSLSKNINPNLVLVQPRKTPPFITERLLMGHKESNQTKQTNKSLFLGNPLRGNL